MDDDVTNANLEKLFYPERKTSVRHYAEPDYAHIHKEPSKKGVTLTLLWQEYCERVYANGVPYMSTQFGDKYRRWARVTKATVSLLNITVQLSFLPVYENRRTRLVERSVGFSATWITAALRESKFLSFSEIRDAVAERHTKPFHKRSGSRKDAYFEEEKEFMLPLPKRPYEPSVWKQQTVGNDYLISDGLNKYSVPFDLIGEQVQIRLTKDLVEVYFKGSRMTSHERLEKYSVQPVVKPEHMPSNHREYLNYNADEFRVWAETLGGSTEKVVNYFLTSGSVPEQGYKACIGLTKLGKRYGKKALEAACERMLAFSSSPSIRTITTLLKNSNEPIKSAASSDDSNKYGITQGAAYWKKGGDGK